MPALPGFAGQSGTFPYSKHDATRSSLRYTQGTGSCSDPRVTVPATTIDAVALTSSGENDGERTVSEDAGNQQKNDLTPGKHTVVFDFKYDGPGPAKGGTGVLTVDGGEPARKKVEHTIPFLMSIDESFDIGSDTRTGVDDSYKLPFSFSGTIDKLTFKLGPEQLTAEDRSKMQEALAKAHD
jgi:hypothetical protein